VIGGGDLAKDRLIPDLVRAFQNGSDVTIRSPKSTRPWQHVLDPLLGYIAAVENTFLSIGQDSYNFGPAEISLAVNEVVSIFRKSIGSDIRVIFEEEKNDIEAKTLDLDSTLAQKSLKWKPLCNQEEAIEMTFKWWRSVLVEGVDPEIATKNDITELLSRLG
jgi:CDP-glucose 4,6-dehydratase